MHTMTQKLAYYKILLALDPLSTSKLTLQICIFCRSFLTSSPSLTFFCFFPFHMDRAAAAAFLLLLASIFSYPFVLIAQSPTPTISRINVVGVVYCDTCSSSTFSKQSYFLPGAEVHIQCRFRATSPKTTEQISFTANRTTDQHGVYKLDIPSVDGVNCVDGSAIVSLCQASLIRSSSSSCNVPFLKSTTTEISVKSRQENLCVYSLSGLSYKPSQKNTTLCGQYQKKSSLHSNTSTTTMSLDSSKFYSPYLPPYGFPRPPVPQLPFPPLPSIPFPSIPPLPPLHFPPLPFQNSPPSLPFPFPQLPPYPSTPYGVSPPFNLGDPTTWGPHVPALSHPSPPPPPSPAFNFGDPTTWIPHISSPSPPNIPQNQNP